MSKKDVLMMCQFFYPEYITSALLPYQTAIELAESGIDVDVITGYPKEYNNKKKVKKKETINNINIKRIKYLQLSRGSAISRLINYFSFIVSMMTQVFKIRKYKILIVYSNPPILPIIALIANKLFNTKIIFVAFDIYPEIGIETNKIDENGIITQVMTWLNRRIYPISNVVAVSHEMKKFIINNREVSPQKVHVIENWATEEIPKNNNNSQKIKKNDSTFVISYLGNMGIPQEFKTVLEAMSSEKIKKSNIEFHFAGHGNQRYKISEYIKNNNLTNVHLHGYLQNKEFEELVNKTDAFFLSLKDQISGLALPSKFYTYLLYEKPILAVINSSSDVAKDIKQHKIGYSVDEGRVEDLVEAIIKIKSMEYPDEDIYHNYYSKNIQLEKYVTLIKELLIGK